MNRTYLLILLFCLQLSGLPLRGESLFFHHLTPEHGLPNNTVNAFVEDKYGFIWMATLEGVCRFDGYKVVNYSTGNAENTLISNRIVNLYRDEAGDVWMVPTAASSNRVCRYNYATDDFTRMDLSMLGPMLQEALSENIPYNTRTANPESAKQSCQAHDGTRSWHLTGNLLTQTDHRTGEQYRYTEANAQEGNLTDPYVSTIYLDRNEILWVGTVNGGVHYADINRNRFTHTLYDTRNSIRALCEDDKGQLWIGTRDGGVLRSNRQTGSLEPFDYHSVDGNQHEEKMVRRILSDSRGDMWIGTRKGLFHYDTHTEEIAHYSRYTEPALPSSRVYALCEDRRGLIWIGTWDKMVVYNPQAEEPFTYLQDSILAVRGLAMGLDGGIWAATEKGLFFLDYQVVEGRVEEVKTTAFHYDEANPHFVSDFIYSLDVDDEGNVWLGTAKGLCMYDVSRQEFVCFPDIAYISEVSIKGVLCYKEYVWVSYGRRLTRLHREHFTARHYGKMDGLVNQEFSEDAYYKNTQSGELFFGGNNWVKSFFPDEMQDNSYPPKLLFTGLKVRNKPVAIGQKIDDEVLLRQTLFTTESLEFTHRQREFEVEFAALHYANATQNRYAYRLVGFDKEWIEVDAQRRSAIYSGVPAGKYTLEVKAANCDGLWNEEPIRMAIRILPPWWASPWAYTLYVLLGLALFALALRVILWRKNLTHQMQLEQLKSERSEEISQLRTSFFTAISHELRTPITLLIDPLQRLLAEQVAETDRKPTYQLMAHNAHRLLHLINQLLDFRKVETSKSVLKPMKQELVAFVCSRVELFQFTAQQRNISLTVESDAAAHLLAFDAAILDKILTNLLSNALKYSPDHTAIVVKLFAPNDQQIAIQVIDQGVGISDEGKAHIFDLFYRVEGSEQVVGSGIGLALTKELVTLHQGEISVESRLGEGSCFTVTLPVNLAGEFGEMGDRACPVSTEDISVIDSTPSIVETDIMETDGVVETGHAMSPTTDSITETPQLLIVEDNTDIRTYLADNLSAEYQVTTAVDGAEGWERALEVVPDLLLSDVMMPRMSGTELCERMKIDPRTSHIPVVLLTARQSEEARMEGYETGADDYVEKPFSLALLRVRIKNLIESRQRLRQLFGQATHAELKRISTNTTDEQFINRAVELVYEHLDSLDFTPDLFAREMAVSRAQLFRKIKAMTGQTVQEFIVTLKLNRAAEWLLTTEMKVADIAIQCGFSDTSNFRRSFIKKFGVAPSEYRAQCGRMDQK